jgi:hypothetical protein
VVASARFGAFITAAALRHMPVRADFLQLVGHRKATPDWGGSPLRLVQRVMPMLCQLLDHCVVSDRMERKVQRVKTTQTPIAQRSQQKLHFDHIS